jgi:MFS family permease
MNSGTTTPRHAWLLLAFLTLLNIVNFVDRQLITSLQVPIREELGLTPLQITVLAGYAFAVIYAIAGLLLGTVADRWHRPRLIALGLFVWSALTAASGLAQNFWQLGAARFFIGIGEATLTPAAIAMLADVFPPRRRALASGLYYLGIPIGAGLSLIVASLVGPIPAIGWPGTSWRYCFLALGLVGVALVAALLLIKDPARGASETQIAGRGDSEATHSLPQMLGNALVTLRRSPALVLTMVSGVLINVSVGSTWLDPSWLVRERGYDHSRAALLLGVCFLIGGSLGNLVGGWLGDVFHKRWSGGRLVALVILQIVVWPFGIAFRLLPPDSPMFPVGALASAMSVTILYGPIYASVQELTPLRIRATMVAVLIVGLMLLGASLGGPLAAYLAEQFAAAGFTQPLTAGIFITGQVGLLAIPLLLVAARRYHYDLAQVHKLDPEEEETPCARPSLSPAPGRL